MYRLSELALPIEKMFDGSSQTEELSTESKTCRK